jgi:hypothetical protein
LMMRGNYPGRRAVPSRVMVGLDPAIVRSCAHIIGEVRVLFRETCIRPVADHNLALGLDPGVRSREAGVGSNGRRTGNP